MFDQHTLSIIFVALMGLAVLLYAILDGYDLGVGILLPLNNEADADVMIASIGPFWDANETWLVLAVGLLLIAFPQAHSLVFKALYFPTAIMLVGLILRGVAFDFRAKANMSHKASWDMAFKLGSIIASAAQGYMLGMYVMGFEQSITSQLFAILSAFGVTFAYAFIGSAWLVMKTEHQLQARAIRTCFSSAIVAFFGIFMVSIANLFLSDHIFTKWFSTQYSLLLLVIPVICGMLFILCLKQLTHLKLNPHKGESKPFLFSVGIFTFSFIGLGFSFFPDVVPGEMTIWEAVAAPEALNFLLWGAIIVVPTILLYTVFSYRVFWGKATHLRYY